MGVNISLPSTWTTRSAYRYDLTWIIVLGLLAAGYAVQPAWSWLHHWVFAFQDVVPLWVPWAGALGGVTISLVGVAKHAVDWDAPKYGYWHLSRPFLGAVCGTIGVLIVVLLLRSVTPPAAGAHYTPGATGILAVIAFVVGYREETFRDLITKVVDVILGPGDTTSAQPVALVPSLLDFAKVAVNAPKTVTASLFNGGSDTIHVKGDSVSIEPGIDDLLAIIEDTDLTPGTSMPIQLTWTPRSALTLSATLVVTTEARRITALIKGVSQ
jgi:hypothetical protein